MNPENIRAIGPENAEIEENQQARIQYAIAESLGPSSSASGWDAKILEQLALDYYTALFSIETACGGRWRNVRVINTEHGKGREKTTKTTIVPAGEPENPYFDLDTIAEKDYLTGLERKRLILKKTFSNAVELLTENKSMEELIILRRKRLGRSGALSAERNSRSTRKTYGSSDNNSS